MCTSKIEFESDVLGDNPRIALPLLEAERAGME
jgi:hypothetical protein